MVVVSVNMETTTATPIAQAASTKRDRWLFFLIITLALNLAALILFPMFLKDALTPPLTAICGIPTIWGLYTMLCFRTGRERIVGYVGIVAAVAWAAALVNLLSRYGWDAR